MARISGIPRNPRRNRANQGRGYQTGEEGEQDRFFEIRDAVLVSVEGRDEEVVRGVVEVAELRVYEGFHPRGDLIDSVPFVSATGSEYERFAIQALLDVSICIGDA